MTIARVSGQNGGAFGDSGTASTKAFAGNVTAGNLVVVQASRYTTTSMAFVAGDCTKSAGTATLGEIMFHGERTWVNGVGNNYSIAIWSAIVTATGSCTMRVDNPGTGYVIMAVQELSGSWDANRYETRNDNTGDLPTPGAPDSGNATSAGGAIFFATLATDTAFNVTHTIDGAYTLNYEMEDGTAHQTGAFGDRIVTTGTTDSASWTAPTTIAWGCMVTVLKEAVTSLVLEQEGFRFRNDDGSESAATWLANQDTNISQPALTNTRLRFLINATGDPASQRYKLRYRRVGDEGWRDLGT